MERDLVRRGLNQASQQLNPVGGLCGSLRRQYGAAAHPRTRTINAGNGYGVDSPLLDTWIDQGIVDDATDADTDDTE